MLTARIFTALIVLFSINTFAFQTERVEGIAKVEFALQYTMTCAAIGCPPSQPYYEIVLVPEDGPLAGQQLLTGAQSEIGEIEKPEFMSLVEMDLAEGDMVEFSADVKYGILINKLHYIMPMAQIQPMPINSFIKPVFQDWTAGRIMATIVDVDSDKGFPVETLKVTVEVPCHLSVKAPIIERHIDSTRVGIEMEEIASPFCKGLPRETTVEVPVFQMEATPISFISGDEIVDIEL